MSKEKLLLLGAGGFGRVVLEHAEKEYDCFFLDDGIKTGTVINGVPVIGKIRDMEKFFPAYKLLLVTIGNNKLRQVLYDKALIIGYTFPNIIVSSAYVSPYAILGTGIIVLNNVVIQNNAVIGNGTILNPGVEAHQDSIIGNCCLIYSNSVVRSLANVGNRVYIGSTSTILTGTTVPVDTIINDGSVFVSEN